MEKEGRRLLPPYGPTRGTVQALQLLQRQSPPRVDEALLRSQGIAPGNEYKVVGALRFLGIIDEQGRPTDRAQGLKTRGAAFTLHLQEIVREAYADLLRQVGAKQATQEAVYNYFVAHIRLGAEMAAKATRFFRSLCQWADIPLPEQESRRRGRPRAARPQTAQGRRGLAGEASPSSTTLPLVLALTPETAAMGEEELAELFRKIRRAAQRASR
jgi:hypothetical protein